MRCNAFGMAVVVLAGTVGGCSERVPEGEWDAPEVSVALVDDEEWFIAPPFVAVGRAADGGDVGGPLHLVRGGALLENGGFVLAVESTQTIRHYDPSGVLVREIGRQGDGPGEFRRLRAVYYLGGDTLLAWDPGQERITAFALSGRARETFRLSDEVGRAPPLDVTPLGGGVLLTLSSSMLARTGRLPSPGFHRDSVVLRLVGRQGNTIADLGPVPGTHIIVGEEAWPVPFSYRLHVAYGTEAFFVGNGRGAEVVEFTADGVPRRRLELPIERRLVNLEDLRELREATLARFRPEDRPGIARTFQVGLAAVDSVPAFTDLHVSEDGILWLKLYQDSRLDSGWLAVNLRALTARQVAFPTGVKVLDIRFGMVLMLARDELDREVVYASHICSRQPTDTSHVSSSC